MKKIKVCMMLVLLPAFLHAQNTFDMVYDMEEGYENNNGLFLAVAEDGIVGLSGTLCNNGSTVISCMELFKTNFEGQLLWTERFKDTISHMVPGGGGVSVVDNQIVVGSLRRLGQGYKLFIMKNSLEDGMEEDYAEYSELGVSRAYSMMGLRAISGSRFLICESSFKDGEYANPVLMKTSPDLTVAWQETISLPGYDFVFPRDFDLVGDGGEDGYVMSVTVEDGATSIYQFASILRTDTLGSILWRHDLETNHLFNPMVKSLHNGRFAIGWSKDEDDYPLGEDDYPLFPYIAILNDTGGMEQVHHFIAPYRKEISRIRIASNGDIIGCGFAQNPNMHNTAAWLFRLSPDAELLWEREYSNEELYIANGIPTCPFFDVVETPDGGLAATGCVATPSNPAGVWEGNVWLMKVDGQGCLEPGCTEQEIILAVEETESGLLRAVPAGRLRMAPNPARGETLVRLPGAAGAGAELTVCDLHGRPVLRAALPPGARTAPLDVSGLPPGLYLVRQLEGGAAVAAGKLLVTR